MMRIFVYEYTCAQADASRTGSLAAEGRAMLSAVLDDFRRIPGVEAVTLSGGDRRAAFAELASRADYTLLIAPEFEGILAERCRWVEEAGGRLLGPARATVELTGDKLRLAEHLRAAGVATPACCPLSASTIPLPAICKPRHGAGSQATFLIRAGDDLPACVARAAAEGWRGELLVQPYVTGVPVSVAFLIGRKACWPLVPARQHLSNDGRFRYRGGQVPLPGDLGRRAVELARRALEQIPGLFGFVGVDLVVGEVDQVIEINPRLTTSYVGLRPSRNQPRGGDAPRGGGGRNAAPLRAGEVWFTAEGRLERPG